MNGRGSEYVVGRNVRFRWRLAALRAVRRKQLEFVGTTFSAPKTKFAANCAITFRGALGEVEVGGEFDGSANTTSVIRLLGHFFDGDRVEDVKVKATRRVRWRTRTEPKTWNYNINCNYFLNVSRTNLNDCLWRPVRGSLSRVLSSRRKSRVGINAYSASVVRERGATA